MSTEQQDQVPALKVPDLLPLPVKVAAARIYDRERNEGTIEAIKLLNRLTSAAQMQKVWRELTTRRALKTDSSEAFAHPLEFYQSRVARAKQTKAATLRQESSDDFDKATAALLEAEAALGPVSFKAKKMWSEQDCALYCYFSNAHYFARDFNPPLSRRRLGEILGEYCNSARLLKDLSDKLNSFGMDHCAVNLRRIAAEVEDRASWIEVDYEDRGMPIIERQRTEEPLQSYVFHLARTSSVIFKNTNYGTLATTASVALDLKEPVSGTRVREILRSLPHSGLGLADYFWI
jgi:hypothetical protein